MAAENMQSCRAVDTDVMPLGQLHILHLYFTFLFQPVYLRLLHRCDAYDMVYDSQQCLRHSSNPLHALELCAEVLEQLLCFRRSRAHLQVSLLLLLLSWLSISGWGQKAPCKVAIALHYTAITDWCNMLVSLPQGYCVCRWARLLHGTAGN